MVISGFYDVRLSPQNWVLSKKAGHNRYCCKTSEASNSAGDALNVAPAITGKAFPQSLEQDGGPKLGFLRDIVVKSALRKRKGEIRLVSPGSGIKWYVCLPTQTRALFLLSQWSWPHDIHIKPRYNRAVRTYCCSTHFIHKMEGRGSVCDSQPKGQEFDFRLITPIFSHLLYILACPCVCFERFSPSRKRWAPATLFTLKVSRIFRWTFFTPSSSDEVRRWT